MMKKIWIQNTSVLPRAQNRVETFHVAFLLIEQRDTSILEKMLADPMLTTTYRALVRNPFRTSSNRRCNSNSSSVALPSSLRQAPTVILPKCLRTNSTSSRGSKAMQALTAFQEVPARCRAMDLWAMDPLLQATACHLAGPLLQVMAFRVVPRRRVHSLLSNRCRGVHHQLSR